MPECSSPSQRLRRLVTVLAVTTLASLGLAAATPALAAGASTALTITTTSLPGATVGQPYSVQIEATGGTQPYTFGFNNVPEYPLPPGLSMSGSGLISGTVGTLPVDLPTTYTILLTADDSSYNPERTGKQLSITVTPAAYVSPPAPLRITTTAIPDASFNTSYSYQMQATGGTQPYHWSATNLPQGFTLSPDGVLSGYNPLPEQAEISVSVFDSGEGYSNGAGVNSVQFVQQNAQQSYTFTVTSGYPQLDPTFFALSSALSPVDPSTTESEIEALVVQATDLAQALVSQVQYNLIGDLSQAEYNVIENDVCPVLTTAEDTLLPGRFVGCVIPPGLP